ncbi:MAG: TrbI/VirB10 family protein [Sphingomicrobium sp.]
MSGVIDPSSGQTAKEDPETLVLRARPRPAVRFRRGLIVGITGAVAASLVTLSWLALQPPSFRKAESPIDSADERQSTGTPDALANLPKNYGDVPRLGPPLPGDLGRAILDHERGREQPVSGSSAAPDGLSGRQSAAQAERERAMAAREAARTAGLMVQLGAGEPNPPTSIAGGVSGPSAQPPAVESATNAVPAGKQHKIEFAEGEGGPVSSHRIVAPPSPWTLSAGTVIPASLITGLNSDLPGMVVAQVTQNVRDSATGRYILVPQGARLIGKYDSVVAFGQRRALLIWTRIVLPDGSSVELDHMPATDASGYSGVTDGVDSHTWQLLKGIGMSTLLGVGTQLSFGGSGSDLVRALRESTQENVAHAGDQITSRNLDIQPTITVRPGWPVRALVNKDLVLAPWRG